MSDLVAAEWLKLRTTRLLLGTLPLVLLLALAAVAGMVIAADGPAELVSDDGLRRVFSVTGTGAIVMLLVGIVVAAGEARHGTVVDTYLTTPRRERVLTAKLAVVALLALGVGAVVALAVLGLAAGLYPIEDATLPLDQADLWLGLLGSLGYTVLFAVMGVALGTLLRDQVLAVAVSLAWLAVVEHTLVALATDVGRWMPVAAGQAMVRTPAERLLSPLAGSAVLAGYAAALALAAAWAVAHRDT
jgi:ABC-2 type transport system permease protein